MPQPPSELTEKRFGRLTVLSRAASFRNKHRSTGAAWKCQCDCGKAIIVRAVELKRGRTTSCGCSRTAHGRTNTPEFRAFGAAKTRCTNPNHKSYAYYGGRGIEFRFKTFEEFFAELGTRPAGMTLDRIDNDGHYAKGNVRWASRGTQARNRRVAVRGAHV